MQYRTLGRTGWNVSAISFGAWAIGGSWGAVDEQEATRALHRAVDLGINLFDTADVYGDGRSERLLGELRRTRSEPIYIATKAGLRLEPQTAAGFNRANLTAFIERSLRNLGVDAIDLLQLHSPPTDVYYQPETFGVLEDLVRAGKLRAVGVSVNRVEEGLKAIEYPIVQSIQIVYNMFRQRPAELLLNEAKRRQVGVLARLPLSSGMLTGKLTAATVFEPNDHRAYNRKGEAFDRGETFSGVDYQVALDAVDQLRRLVPDGVAMAPWALRWVLMNDAITCAIPGGRTPTQVEDNARAAELPALPPATMAAIRELYDARIKPLVHAYW